MPTPNDRSEIATAASRLTPDTAALVLFDHQMGIMSGVGDMALAELRNNALALAKAAALYELPAVLTTSASDGPNGPLWEAIPEALPDAPIVHRPGQINAWDDEDVVAAIEATGRKQLIMAGVTLDVCLMFPARSAQEAGYEVHAVIDASGTWNPMVAQTVTTDLAARGIRVRNWVSVAGELQQDWRKETGEGLANLFAEHLPFYGGLMSNFAKAQQLASAD